MISTLTTTPAPTFYGGERKDSGIHMGHAWVDDPPSQLNAAAGVSSLYDLVCRYRYRLASRSGDLSLSVYL
jgi:hypothetical protein